MMTSNDSRRGYDDRYDAIDVTRYGRPYDLRGWDGSRRHHGDWMRAHAGTREPAWSRESSWLRETPRDWELDGTSMMNVIDITAQSPHSWEDAARRAIADASRMVRGIRSLWIEDMRAQVDDELGIVFRIHARISFRDRR